MHMRPPLPTAVSMTRPVVVPPSGATMEARLAALEMQRDHDHRIINEIANVLTSVQQDVVQQSSAVQSLVTSGLSLRQEVFTARGELAAGISGANDAAQSAAMAQMAISVEAKFAEMDLLTTNLTESIRALGARGQMVEHVVEMQAAGQPQQEGIISDAFMQMNAKISQVASLARAIDGTQVAPGLNNTVPFTLAMSHDMKDQRAQFANVPAAISGEVMNLTAPLHTQVTEQRVKTLAQDEFITALEGRSVVLEVALTELNSRLAAMPTAAPVCAVCTPSASATSIWGHSPPVAPGTLGPSGAGDPLGNLRAAIGGNNHCHCIHVEELIKRVDKLEANPRAAAG
jgi:uncharacterized coiled-coil protein SlyX